MVSARWNEGLVFGVCALCRGPPCAKDVRRSLDEDAVAAPGE